MALMKKMGVWVALSAAIEVEIFLPSITALPSVPPLPVLPTLPPAVPGLSPYFQPFYQPNECGKALCVRPDMMELDELYEFPEFSRDPTMYLALRNLILAAWHRDCKVTLALGA